MSAERDAERESLLLRGSLDLCVLAILDREPSHAYGIVATLSGFGFRQSSYGTVYPLVTRLRRQGLLTQRTEASPGGPARNVLELSQAGRTALADWSEQWRRSAERVATVLAGHPSVPAQEEQHVVR